MVTARREPAVPLLPVHKAWMPQPCCSSDMAGTSTPYPRGRGRATGGERRPRESLGTQEHQGSQPGPAPAVRDQLKPRLPHQPLPPVLQVGLISLLLVVTVLALTLILAVTLALVLAAAVLILALAAAVLALALVLAVALALVLALALALILAAVLTLALAAAVLILAALAVALALAAAVLILAALALAVALALILAVTLALALLTLLAAPELVLELLLPFLLCELLGFVPQVVELAHQASDPGNPHWLPFLEVPTRCR